MNWAFIWSRIALVVAFLCTGVLCADEEPESATNMKAQRAAVKAWAASLKDQDYDADYWSKKFHYAPANFFEHYATVLSDIFKEEGAKVNFALVGACDGTNDRTIRDRYLPNEHWRGVFVEPFQMNYKDLSNFMEKHGVSHRSHLIHAAATRKCNTTTIKMKRPTFEEKNASLPHWMRRQIGSIVPFTKLNNRMTGGWVAEFTRCVSGPEILQDWTDALNHQSFSGDKAEEELRDAKGGRKDGEDAEDEEGEGGGKGRRHKKKRGGGGGGVRMLRPHVLKVDVEGHDYEVLMGFLGEEMTQSMLPLMINFEAKSITKQFPELKATMESRGYAVSHFATDGFALLRADYINKRPPSGGQAGSTPVISSTAGKRDRARDELAEDPPRSAGGKRDRAPAAAARVDDAVVDRQEEEAEAEAEGRSGGGRKGGKRGGKGGKGGRGGKRKGGKGRRAGAEAEAR